MIKNIIIAALLVISLALGAVLITGNISRKKGSRPKEAKNLYKVAIVIDDMGYNTRNLESIIALRRPVTVAVLPNLAYSKYIAEETSANGMEVMLHLPLEPYEEEGERAPLESDTIRCDMKKEETLAKFDEFLASVPGAKGVSNHMGSKATEDARLMETLFKEIKNRKLYFLDSLVTPKSACKRLAKSMDLRYTKRDIFLDNENDSQYIKGQLDKLRSIAVRRGHAVGVGHDRHLTISAIKENIPKFEKDGVKFVFVSELVK